MSRFWNKLPVEVMRQLPYPPHPHTASNRDDGEVDPEETVHVESDDGA